MVATHLNKINPFKNISYDSNFVKVFHTVTFKHSELIPEYIKFTSFVLSDRGAQLAHRT